MENGDILHIDYNSEESIKIQLIGRTPSSEVKKALKKFKETEKYKSDEWDDDELLDFLEEEGIEFDHIPNQSDEVIHLPSL